MRLHDCMFCRDCIDREIVTSIRIEQVISDPQNHAFERQRIIELLRERNRLVEERDRITAIPDGDPASGENHQPSTIPDNHSLS